MQVELLETFITGHPVIDGEHAEIVNMINAVSHSIENEEHEKCEELLEAFLVLCDEHFKSEEALLADAEYPELKDHMTFHHELMLKAQGVKALCVNTESPETLKRCFDEMATLLIEDVVRGDMQFVSFLKEKNII
ncbi:hemerythrin family protein [Magnetovibrio sp. PR-2]|uniref:bacteriohemerythrin n=1 Tax=Magnetovibrio sp. PR-2 TaxID=3120356 RepID=UPI002FCE631C